MLARDWYYNQRRQIGLDSAVASIYDRHDDSDLRARAALTMLGVQKGWRLADIGCGNGVLACEAALMGAEVDAIDISPAMLALANIQARDRKVAIRTQPAGMLSFAYQPNSYDLIVSEFTLHHLPDFWKAVALAKIYAALKPGANFYLRDIVFVSMPDGTERNVEQWADFSIKNHDFERDSVVTHMRDEYSTFGWVIERMLTDMASRCNSRLPCAAARHLRLAQTKAGPTELTRPAEPRTNRAKMKPADVCFAVLVAVIWGLAFVASRIALDEFSPELMTTLRFSIAALPCLFVSAAEGFMGRAGLDRVHAVPRPVSGAGLRDGPWCSRRPLQRDRAEPGAVHHRLCGALVRRAAKHMADGRHRHRHGRPADDLRHRRL